MKRKKERILKKSMREKKRYLLFRGPKSKVEEAILDYVGILGYAKACPVFVSKNILAVNRKEVEKIKAALFLSDIEVLKVSGTLKKLRS